MHSAMEVDQKLLHLVREALTFTDKEQIEALRKFESGHPTYTKTRALDDLRAEDYARLDSLGHIYLDYTGGGLYGESQLRQHMELLASGVYGNPHSMNPTSLAMTELDERARHFVLEYFNADPREYLVIFTSNASGALKLVGESYPFEQNGQYLLTFDNHNSVNGIREFAHAKGAPVTYTPLLPDTLRIDEDALHKNLAAALPGGNNLFAYPAQSNFSGVQHPLEWIETAHQHGWDVLLDAAAFAPTNRLDLSIWKPDFVSLSFYKMFGYPTGIGALIARRDTVRKLHRPWFAGGTITVASVQGQGYYLHTNEAGFEDGTINYLNIPAVEIGLRHLLDADIDVIHERVLALTGYLLSEMTALRHDNGQPLLHIYGPTSTEMRGGTISFNLYDLDGIIFDYRLVEGLANDVSISLRTGCFCNPGAGEIAHGISGEKMRECFQSENELSFEQLVIALTRSGDAEAVGAVRVSVGLASNFSDAWRLIRFLSAFRNAHSEGLLFD